MSKTFKELYDLDISEHTKKLDGSEFAYLPWIDCRRILMENGMMPTFWCTEVLWSPDGKQALVDVCVEINGGARYSIIHPVKCYEYPTAEQIANTVPRAFVKCVALNWGLGFKLWENVDTDPSVPVDTESVKRKAREMTMAFAEKIPKYGSSDAVHAELGTTKKFLSDIMESGTMEEITMMIKRIDKI